MRLPQDRPIFLERAAYRRRRLQDAARLLPLVTLMALLLPVWLVPGAMSGAGGMVVLFGVWTLVILASALLHRRLARRLPSDSPPSGAAASESPPDEL